MAGASVLVLVPDPLQRDLILMALRRAGMEPLVGDVGDTPRLLLERKPSLMILDLTLPERNGLDLLDELRQAGLLVLTRVIVLSALTFPDVVKRAKRMGATDFLAKPIDVETLLQRVETLVRSRDS
jgi:putative two-component system response regulator